MMIENRLDGRIAIVTGAGGGLGRAHAKFLAKQGGKIVVNDISEDAAKSVAEEISASGGDAIAIAGSVTDENQVQHIIDQTQLKWGRVDILINNAGILRDKSFAKMTMDDFRLVMDVHVMGAAICCKAVWPVMREQEYGRIVMTTSSSGLYGNFGQANYGAAKMALVGLMQTLAIEGHKYGICVNALAPTAATGMTEGVLNEDVMKFLDPSFVSPALLPLVSDGAPTRTILCAGAGHVASANVTLTPGAYIGQDTDAASVVFEKLPDIRSREGDVIPDYGFAQFENEVASARRNMTSKVGE